MEKKIHAEFWWLSTGSIWVTFFIWTTSILLHYNGQNNFVEVKAWVEKNNYILCIIWKFCFMFVWTEKQHFSSSNIVIIIAHCTIHFRSQDLNVVVLIKHSKNYHTNANGSMFFWQTLCKIAPFPKIPSLMWIILKLLIHQFFNTIANFLIKRARTHITPYRYLLKYVTFCIPNSL